MGFVAIGTSPLGNRPVNDGPVGLTLEIAMATCAQRTWALAQKGAVAGHMWVVTGRALSACERRVCDLGPKGVLQVVAAETNLLLIDLASGRELGQTDERPKEKTTDCQPENRKALFNQTHRPPPGLSSSSSWQMEQSPSAKGMCTSGRSIPATCDAWGS